MSHGLKRQKTLMITADPTLHQALNPVLGPRGM